MNMKELGDLAELVVKEYFSNKGSVVEMSADPFDGVKDMTIDGAHTEVKFQTIYHRFRSYDREEFYEAFTVPITSSNNKVSQNQLDKCLNADRWLILQNPTGDKRIKLWEAPPLGKRRFKIIRNSKDGRITAGFAKSMFKNVFDIEHDSLYNKISRLNMSRY